jgi:dimethylglycine dehydrogenase
MKSSARAVIIGGGVVGASTLYHLAKIGWSDVLLLEKSELTSGSTWHAAGGMHTFNGEANISRLQKYTIDLYREIEALSGQSCGLHPNGGLMLAATQGELDSLKLICSRARYLGMETEMISLDEAKRLNPLIDTQHFIGALWRADGGHCDPSGTTQAYVKAARLLGASVERFTRVLSLSPRSDGSWDVVTDKGNVHAEHVVNCGGLWAREIGHMVGIELPVLAMEHHYLITEDIPELKGRDKEIVNTTDYAGEIYMRQERGGALIGTYEPHGLVWAPLKTPDDFAMQLLADDFERLAPYFEVGFRHFPALGQVGIRKAVNGPFTFAPDGNPLVGPVRGVRNFWVACAVMAGFSQGGGVGLALSEWMVNGDPGFDVWAMDVARFGEWATRSYTNEKVRENYAHRFSIRFPNEEMPAARPQQTTALYDAMLAQGAVMGDSWGLETPLWFAPKGVEPKDVVSFHRSNDFPHVKAECLGVRNGVGLTEIANFAKYEITGAGAEAYLGRLMTNRMPKPGRLVLTPMLNPRGRLIGDFTIACAAPGRYLMWGSSQAQLYHMRWFEAELPADGSVRLRRFDMGLVGLSIAGPRSRELLSRLTDEDVSATGLRFMDHRAMDIASCPAMINRVTYSGDLGYEIWVAPEYQRRLYERICAAGADLGLVHFGMRALLCLRLEKNFPTWYRELRPIYGAFEAGLDRFVDLSKPDFIGRAAALAEKASGGKLRRVSFAVDALDADVLGDEPIWRDGAVIGWATSGGYGHFVERSLAQGYVPAALATDARAGAFEIEILGDRRPATILTEAPFDPTGSRMRM